MLMKYLKDKNAIILYEFDSQYEFTAQEASQSSESRGYPTVSLVWQHAVITLDGSLAPHQTSLDQLFTPEFWEKRQAIIRRAPGRGESLFICPEQLFSSQHVMYEQSTPQRHDQREVWVLRPYRRGGMIARFNAQRYLWMGIERTRAFKELRLTNTLREQGLPVPQVLGACVWKEGLTYEAALLSVRIPGALPLAEKITTLVNSTDQDPNTLRTLLQHVGSIIRQAHDLGLDHVDLNARNILVDNDMQAWIIDLDRCQLRSGKNHKRDKIQKWQKNNLERLGRSLEKFVPGQGNALLKQIEQGYYR